MKDRTDVTVPIPKDLNDAIEAELSYGDSKAGWIREAIRQRLERDAEGSEGNPTPATQTAD